MLRSIYLVHHGESVSNAGCMTMPHALIPPTEAGRKQANAHMLDCQLKPRGFLPRPLLGRWTQPSLAPGERPSAGAGS